MTTFLPLGIEVSQGGTPEVVEVAWCNLCRAEGRVYEIVAEDGWTESMQKHTEAEHPEHEAALRRGETYVPVEVEP
jgi:hypothetical protein